MNQEKFNEAMIALMEDRFAGGMEKQATTMKGLWSTVTGVTKSALATITGIMSGEIRIMVGEPTPSSNLAFTWSSRLEISMERSPYWCPAQIPA